MKKLTLLLLIYCMLLPISPLTQAADEQWENLFDGKTLDGWIQKNGQAKYTVEDGVIVGTTVLNTPNSFLCTKKNYTDFVLELEFIVQPGMNSGIQIRSHSYKAYNNYRVHGYQVEIDTSDRAWSAGIYDEARRGWLFDLKDKPQAQKAFKQNQWNKYRIMAVGDRIRTWVNGVPAADLTDDMTSTGFIALQVHNSNTAGQQIKWRNIRIQDLSQDDSKRPLKALIVDGQNNHDWKSTTPVLKSLLEDTGLFVVDVATTPRSRQPMDSFKPDFSKYNVIVANYTGDNWPQETQDAFEKYMNNGGGLVVFHAADNAFPNWKEWNEMIGLGGWGGRNEKSGPMVRFRDGKIVFDTSPGAGGTHGPQHEFQVVARDKLHEIMAGLPEKWMHASDELYSKLRGPAKNMTLLATAYADPAKGGTGENEPMLFTIRYGKGRIFHTVLGHAPDQMRCVGFIVTYLRGTEWAATGRVTQVDVPDDFPTADKVSLRIPISADYSAIEDYDFGKSRQALAGIEEEIRIQPVSSFPQIEARLLEALNSSRTTFAGKQFVCRMLRRIGSAKSVPALSEMLADKEFSHIARFALQYMDAPEAGAALRKALGELDGDLKIGVIGSIAQRGDRKTVSEIGKLVTSSDTKMAGAAIRALGRIGGVEAAGILAKAKTPADLKSELDNSYLMCADKMVAEGQTDRAAAIYREMVAPSNNTWIRIAAYKGLVAADKEKAVPHILALLKDENLDLQRAAGKFFTEIPGTAITKALAQQIDNLSKDGQVVLVSALEARGDKAAAPYVAKAVGSNSEPVRLAAIKALAVIGDSSSVQLLAKASAHGGDTEKAAMDTLSSMSAPNVTSALVKVATSKEASAVRVNAIQTLINRHDVGAVPVMFGVAKDSDRRISQAAYKALGALAGQKEMPVMVSMLLDAGNSANRSAIERAIVSTVTRIENPDAAPIVSAMAKADDSVKPNLLAVLPRIGSTQALKAVRSQLDSSKSNVKRAAVRALADWPNPEPLADLINMARSSGDSTEQVLALRGYIKLLAVPANRGASDTVKLLGDAMQAAKRSEEKKSVLSALAKYPCDEGLKMAEAAATNADLRSEAELAAKKIKQALVNRSLKATASHNSGNAKNALDGNPETRWDSAATMKPGFWFMLDLGVENTIEGLTLDTRNSSNDYPRGYEVYVSFDGGSWGKPVVKGDDAKPLTEIKFSEPVKARYIKIVQLGASDSWYWSIHELSVKLK